MITFVPINNPRTVDGGWEDGTYGCHNCQKITSAYIGIEFSFCGMHLAMIKLCKGCLIKGEDLINGLILDQSKTRVK